MRIILTQARSRISAAPDLCAQCPQQYRVPCTSMPCPMIRHLQCAQVGAIACIAHSKESYVPVFPRIITWKVLS